MLFLQTLIIVLQKNKIYFHKTIWAFRKKTMYKLKYYDKI
jgi:hypothetical protein